MEVGGRHTHQSHFWLRYSTLLIYMYMICDLHTDKREYISREEFESKFQSQQREIESLQAQLNYWQNTTIKILMKYPINGEGESSSCTVELEDELSLKDLSQQMEEIFNQTQGKATILYHYHLHNISIMMKSLKFALNPY